MDTKGRFPAMQAARPHQATLAADPGPEDVRIDPAGGGAWVLRARQRIPLGRAALFPFFADAANLGRITPSEMRFQILTPLPVAMREGALIEISAIAVLPDNPLPSGERTG